MCVYVYLDPELIYSVKLRVLLCILVLLQYSIPCVYVCVCRELETLQGDVVESKLTMDGKQKVGVATSKFIATTLGLPFNREVAMVFGLSLTLSLQRLVSKRKITFPKSGAFWSLTTWPQVLVDMLHDPITASSFIDSSHNDNLKTWLLTCAGTGGGRGQHCEVACSGGGTEGDIEEWRPENSRTGEDKVSLTQEVLRGANE